MNRHAVILSPDLRVMACRAIAEALLHHRVELIDLCVGSTHFHLLVRFTLCTETLTPPDESPGSPDPGSYPRTGDPGLSIGVRKSVKRSAYDHDPHPRFVLGKAKSWSTRILKQSGHYSDHQGGLWAVRSKIESITDRPHQLHVEQYIGDHVDQDAAVWSKLPGTS